jgi:hypothetical protein
MSPGWTWDAEVDEAVEEDTVVVAAAEAAVEEAPQETETESFTKLGVTALLGFQTSFRLRFARVVPSEFSRQSTRQSPVLKTVNNAASSDVDSSTYPTCFLTILVSAQLEYSTLKLPFNCRKTVSVGLFTFCGSV